MSWTLNYKGKTYAVPNGQAYTITEQRPGMGGGTTVDQKVFYEDGTNYIAKSQHYPEQQAGMWRTEEELYNPKIEDLEATPPEIYKKLMQMENKEPDQMPKERLQTGQRLHFRHPRTDVWVGGTVINPNIGRKNEMPPLPEGRVLICADEIDLETFRQAPELTGRGYGIIVSQNHISMLPKNFSTEAYDTVPDHIGVVVVQEFLHDDVTFTRYDTGRLLQLDREKNTAFISWYKKENDRFVYSKVRRASGLIVQWTNCYHVPIKHLNWCRMSSGRSVEVIWPGRFLPQTPEFNVGDYVVYTADRPLKVAGADGHYFAVAKGAILQITGQDNHVHHYMIRTVSSCRKGLEARLTSDAFVRLEASYLPGGTPVEITAHLKFKKRDLQGQKGVIVLPTDSDGDVGVEFNEDIGAGSLDGHGKSRHCLYVPADSVQALTK